MTEANPKILGHDGLTVIRLLRRLYDAAFEVDSGLQRECDHATYEGNTEAVDELREILGLLEAEFTSLIYTPGTDDDA
jgi:hypothetical protein